MKYLILFLACLSFSLPSLSLVIVTDLDDTLKITNVLDRSEATRNALFSKKAFLKFPELLNNMNQYAHGLYVLSASPTFLSNRVNKFLNFHHISRNDVYLRNLVRERDSFKFKLEKLKELFEDRPHESFILIGDDTENDPRVYANMREIYPNQVEQIYIRSIKNLKQPEFIKTFFSAYDVAMYEYSRGRMGLNETLMIGNSVLFAKDLKLVFPHFSYCPKKKSEFYSSNSVTLELLNIQVKNRLSKFCKTSVLTK